MTSAICTQCGAALLTEEWRDVLTGGNHLANILIHLVGPDFADRLPPDLDPQAAGGLLHADQTFDVWCAWAAIMRARKTLPSDKPAGKEMATMTEEEAIRKLDDALHLIMDKSTGAVEELADEAHKIVHDLAFALAQKRKARKDDAAFLSKVADMVSREDGDAPGNEGIWALKLRAIAASFNELPSRD